MKRLIIQSALIAVTLFSSTVAQASSAESEKPMKLSEYLAEVSSLIDGLVDLSHKVTYYSNTGQISPREAAGYYDRLTKDMREMIDSKEKEIYKCLVGTSTLVCDLDL